MILFDQTAKATTNPQGLIQKAWVKYKGNTNWPTPGQAKYLKVVMLANDLKNQWATDAKVHWDSLFVIREYGPIGADTQAYDLDNDIFYLSDWVYVLRTDGNTDRFSVVHPESRNRAFSGIGIIGSDAGDPLVYLTGIWALGAGVLTLNFQTPWAQQNAQDVGGTILVGAYALPSDFANPNDKIMINNPEWLVARLAAELSRNDPAKQDQFDPLMQEADGIYQRMVLDNQGNSYQQPNGPAYALPNSGITWTQS